ncbi:carboxypeptidase-like regulatory domain-containing protein [Salibacter halophilus]|uniref:Carboxypeptidase-like regulatory domain-containing protein n=1 Tax=Salibacter halophilus TaxID=1803916 RepID=A0A6N6M853_9FLAO|nr:carboxypeptidase-like regulatory domain-containing protein [Salibacter halophilus]KAB1066084.1 carboxypeptidase-like regulatory domain-containing protein [Salibacter halophilus]
MSRLSIILLVGFLLSCFNTFSQSTKFSGVVIDKDTRESIPFVHFESASNQGIGFVSSENGSYKFQFNLDKSDTFSISVIGYKNLKVSVSELMNTDTVYMESKQLELNEFVVRAKPKTAREIFEEALESFNQKEYKDHDFIAGYEELLVSKDKQDTSFMRANCVITGFSPKEKTGLFNAKFHEKVAILDVDSYKLDTDHKIMNHLLHMTQETKINDMSSFSHGLNFMVTDTTINKDGHVVFKLSGRYSDGTPSLEAIIDVTDKRFLQLTNFLKCMKGGTAYYRAVFSDYLDVGLPTRVEMFICSDKPEFLEKKYKGMSVGVSLILHKKVTTPIETESWVEGSKSMFEGEIDLELKEKLGY